MLPAGGSSCAPGDSSLPDGPTSPLGSVSLLAARSHCGHGRAAATQSSAGPIGRRLRRGCQVAGRAEAASPALRQALAHGFVVPFLVLPGWLAACLGAGTTEAERECATCCVCQACPTSVLSQCPGLQGRREGWVRGRARGSMLADSQLRGSLLRPRGHPQSPQGGCPLVSCSGDTAKGLFSNRQKTGMTLKDITDGTVIARGQRKPTWVLRIPVPLPASPW